MVSRNFSMYFVGLIGWMALSAGCQMHRGTDSRNVLGAVEIRDEQIKGQWPAELPRTVYVSDFILDAQRIEGDQGRPGRSARWTFRTDRTAIAASDGKLESSSTGQRNR